MNVAAPDERGQQPSIALDRELGRLGAGCLLVLGGEPGDADLAPFVGRARLGEAFVIAPRGGSPRLGYWTPMEREEAAASGLELLEPEGLGLPELTRSHRAPGARLAALLARAFDALAIAPCRVALAGRWPAGEVEEACHRLRTEGWSFVGAGQALRRCRKRKSPGEIDEVRRVASVTCEVLRGVARQLATAGERGGELELEGEPLSVGRIRREVGLACAAAGLTQPRQPIVAPAEEGGVPHNGGTEERVLRVGESLVVDVFPKDRLFADCTRTFCVGAPPEALRRAHEDVSAALTCAHAGCRPGRRGWELQREVCQLLHERGWPTPVDAPGSRRGYVHNLGHGVGFELHELPSFREDADPDEGVLEPGDLVTLEPGIYEPGAGGFGVRLEDLVLLTETGAENLTPLPRALDPRAW